MKLKLLYFNDIKSLTETLFFWQNDFQYKWKEIYRLNIFSQLSNFISNNSSEIKIKFSLTFVESCMDCSIKLWVPCI